MITVTLNGETQVIHDRLSLSELLENIGITPQTSKGIAVAHNLSVIPREQWETLSLTDGDQIDVLHAIQGG